MTAPELIFPARQWHWGWGQCGNGGHQDHYPSTKRVWGLSSIPQCRKPLRAQVPFQWRDYRAAGAGGGEHGEWFVFDLAQQIHLHQCPAGLSSGSRKPSVLEVT